MLSRTSIFLGLMLTGTLAAAALVTQDDATGGAVVAPVANRDARPAPGAREQRSGLPVLQLDKLARAEAETPQGDPFAGKSWYVPPPPPPEIKPQEPPRPTAPPLPFGYMGRMTKEGGQEEFYLVQGGRAITASAGDTIDGNYRLEGVSAGQLVFTYLPLDIKQTLNLNGAASGAMAVAAPVTVAPLDAMPNAGMSR